MNLITEILQPWSTFVMKTQLPSEVLQKMLKITDEIVDSGTDPAIARNAVGAGEMEEQFLIDFKILEQEGLADFFLEASKEYVIQAFCQMNPDNKEAILEQNWMTRFTIMWINSQRDNEYVPLHCHQNAHIAAVCYIKIPEYLPALNAPHSTPGAIEFISNTSNNSLWGSKSLKVKPQIGDFFLFAIDQQHCVYPFKTLDGKGERRSVAFNVELGGPPEIFWNMAPTNPLFVPKINL
tara:strand:- start:1911 stop:2621 length:711 start_codon:yes stop_codon:yes gene_type:complete